MARIPFLGPTYPSRSNNISSDRTINFFPELNPQDSKDVIALIGTPGTSLFVTLGNQAIRGMHVYNDLMFVVAGTYLYSVDVAGAVSSVLGTLNTEVGRVCIKDNGLAVSGIGGDQLTITDGIYGYIYNVTTGVFSTSLASAVMVAYLDGYFIYIVDGSMSYQVSALYDGTTLPGLATSPVSATPDPLKAVLAHSQQLWMMKETSTEVWYDAGIPTTQGSPFLRVSGGVLNFGTSAPWSWAQGAGSLFGLANVRTGDGGSFVGVAKMNGYTPQVITPPAISYQISKFALTYDAFGYCYSSEGHDFYVLTFPAGNATYVFDDTTQMWHERSTYTGSPYAVGRHVGNCYCLFNNQHFIGDYRNGNIYRMSSDYLDDNGSPIVSVRIAQHISDKKNLDNFIISRLLVDIESGVGSAAGSEPKALLAWSDDGGHTWSNNYEVSMGKIGEYKKRAVWRRLGYSRDRVFRLTMADACKKVVIGAYAE